MKRLKSEIPPGEPGPISDPGPESDLPEPSSDRMEGVFRALLDWDLRISFRPSPGGRLYTVAKDPEAGDRDELLVDATAAELVAWVTNRQTQELDADLVKAFSLLSQGGLTVPEDAPLYTLTDAGGHQMLSDMTVEDLRRWASPTTNPTGPVDQRLKAILTRLAGLYLEFYTLRREIDDLVKLAGDAETEDGE